MLSGRLKTILFNKGMTFGEFAEKCEEQEGLPLETVKNVYYGRTNDPKVSTVLKMARVLDYSVNCLMGECPHTKEEREVLGYYKQCGEHGKSIIQLVAKYEAVSAKAERESPDKHKIPCLMPKDRIHEGIVYDTCETIEIETTMKNAYVAIKMTTNDMVPTFCKGDVILYANQFPGNGEYGAFIVGDRAYIRRFIEEEGQYRLKCLHNMGEDIILKRLDDIEYIGTCIGVVRA